LFNTNPENANDADLYIDPSGRLGIGAIGYSAAGIIQPGQWHRIAFVADLAGSTVTYYVDGAAVFSGSADLDGRHSLYSDADAGSDLLLFNEGDSSGVYTHGLLVSSFFVTDRTLGGGEIRDLGGPQARGIAVPIPLLEVRVQLDGSLLQLSWTGGEGPFEIQETDDLRVPDWQHAYGPVSATSASVPLSGRVGFFRVVGQAE
jgi:hypothetical protein